MNLLGGKRRRHLRKDADALAGHSLQQRPVERRGGIGSLRLTLRVVGVGRKTEAETCGIALSPARIKLHQPRGFAKQQDQHAGGQRIERAQMPDLPEAGQVAHGVHHVVGSLSGRLVDDKRAIERGRLWFARHSDLRSRYATGRFFAIHFWAERLDFISLRSWSILAACSSESSSVKCRSGTRRSCKRSRISWRIKPTACSRALMAPFCSSSVPRAPTNTRALRPSGARRTSFTTTEISRRGSFSSPASMALISWAISSPMRSCLWLGAVMSATVFYSIAAPVTRRRESAESSCALRYSKSTEWSTSSGPRIRWASANTCCSDSSTCWLAPDSVTTPTVALCHTS